MLKITVREFGVGSVGDGVGGVVVEVVAVVVVVHGVVKQVC